MSRSEILLLLAALLSFFLLPGYVGVGLCLLAFAGLVVVAPYGSLLLLLAILPLHLLVRRSLGPVELSLPEALLLSMVLGLVASVYWRALTRGSQELTAPARLAAASPYFWPVMMIITMATVSVALPVLTPWTRDGLTVGLRRYSLVVEPLAVYAIVLMTLRDRRRLWMALDVLLASAMVVTCFGLLEAMWYAINPPPRVGGYFRADSVFTHPNSLALYLTRVLPFFGALAIALPASAVRRRVYVASAVLMGILMLLSGSRGGWLAVATGALLTAALVGRFKWLVPVAVGGAAGIVLLVVSGVNRIVPLFTAGNGTDETRQRLWKAALEEIRRSPLWGSGLGDIRWMQRYIPRKRVTTIELIDAHNLLLDFWTKLGLIGVVGLLWILIRFYRTALCVARRQNLTARALAIGLLAAMTASIVHGSVDWFYFQVPLAVLFWFMLGLAEVLKAQDDGTARAFYEQESTEKAFSTKE